MAYTDYSNDQINSEINRLGIGNDPYQLYQASLKYNADPMKVAAARGIDPAAAQAYIKQRQGYTQYSPDQINQFVDSKGVGGNDWALYNFANQYNADPMAVAAARGIDTTRAQQFVSAAPGMLTNQIQGQAQLAQTNPHMAYAAAQARGYTPGVSEQVFGANTGDAQAWANQQGYTGFGRAQMTSTPGASTTGSTPGATPGGAGTAGVGTGGQQRNPYLPAGVQGNDPRVGGPSRWGQPGGNPYLQSLGRFMSDNPHLGAMGGELTRQINNNLFRNVLPQIGDQFAGSGTYGGSRHGIAEGMAIGDSMSALAGSLANLYGGQFNQDRGYDLQSDALDFNIHRGNLSDMRQGQMDQMDFLNRMLGMNQQGVGMATQAYNTPLTRWGQFSDTARGIAGLGKSETQQLNSNPYLGLMAGWQLGSQIGKAFGG